MIPDYRMLTFDIGLKTFAFRNILGKSRLEQINHTYPFYVMEVFFLRKVQWAERSQRKGKDGLVCRALCQQGVQAPGSSVTPQAPGPVGAAWAFCWLSVDEPSVSTVQDKCVSDFVCLLFFFFNEASASNKLVFILNVDI